MNIKFKYNYMKYKKLFFLKNLVALCLYALTSIELQAQEVKAPQTNLTNTMKISPLAQNIAKIGAFSCAERANQISNFLAPDGQAEIILQTPKDNLNNRLLMSSMVIANKESNIVASIALAPDQINGCGGSYRTVFYTPMTCSRAKSLNYPKEKFQNIGKTNTQIAVINRALWIFALPADKGCVFIKEEIIE